jgi:hypothetical protein
VNRMKRLDIRGLEGLPLRLLIVLLLISISSPVVIESLQYHEHTVIVEVLRTMGDRVRSAVLSAYVAGPGNIRSVEVTIPISSRDAQGWMEIGGPKESIESFSIRCWVGDHLIGTLYVSDPPVRMTSQSGSVMTVHGPGSHLEVSCVALDGEMIVLIGVGRN